MEVWKPINGYEGKYSVSSFGNVRNDKTGHITPGRKTGHGYRKVTFYDHNKAIDTAYVHRLVAGAFLKKMPGETEVNHIDGNRWNNNISNLEWVSSSGNTEHAIDNGLLTPWNNPRKPIIATNIETGEEKYFKSMSIAEREIGTRHINLVIRGARSQAKGYTFRYADGGDANVV